MGIAKGEGKERNACRRTPGFWKPPFASERTSWLAGLVENYWQVSIKGLSPLGAKKKWNWYGYKERSLFSTNEDFVESFDNTVEILYCIADASVFRCLHIIAEASSTQFVVVPWILTSTGQKTRPIVGKPIHFIWLATQHAFGFCNVCTLTFH